MQQKDFENFQRKLLLQGCSLQNLIWCLLSTGRLKHSTPPQHCECLAAAWPSFVASASADTLLAPF
jgi:hypothetical protein